MNVQELLRQVNWLAVNLKPFGATRVQATVSDKSVIDQIDGPGLQIEPCASAMQEQANTPPPEGDRAAVRNHIQKVVRRLMNNYWAHGIVKQEDPGPLYVGEPLSMDQARLWASLMGLGGQSLMIGGAILEARNIRFAESLAVRLCVDPHDSGDVPRRPKRSRCGRGSPPPACSTPSIRATYAPTSSS